MYDEILVNTDIGNMLYPAGDIGITKGILNEKTYGGIVRESIISILKPGDTFVDIGAHVGYFTKLASSLVGDSGKVFAFEPHPYNFELLEKNTKDLKNVSVFNIALTNSSQILSIHHSPIHSGDHKIFPWVGGAGSSTIKFDVEGRTLDSFNLNKIKLVKVDTQGSDFLVISGMMETIEKCHPDIIVEFDTFCISCAGISKYEVVKFYKSIKGYKLDVLPKTCLDHCGGLAYFPTNVQYGASIDLYLKYVGE